MGIFRKSKKNDAVVSVDEVVEAVEEEVGAGPFDSSDAPSSDARVDCGCLLLPPVAGTKLQFTVDRRRDVVLGAVYIFDDSALQIQAFAAPKSASIWDDVRADMMASIASQGGSSKEANGEYGKEIRAQMPAEGSKGMNPVRYVGIDGPRWLLRITATGRAAVDDARAAAIMHAVLDDLVVVRGGGAHPPRDILPLTLPRQSGSEAPERPTLKLPQRGPEISEVR